MGQIALGRDKIEAMHSIIFQRVIKHAVLSLDILYVRTVAPDRAMVTCKWKTEGHIDTNHNQLPDRKGIMQVILSLAAEKWLISLIQNFDFTTMYNDVERYQMRLFGM